MSASKEKSNTAKIAPELNSVLKALRRFIPAKEKAHLVEKISDIAQLFGGSSSWFFAPLDEGRVQQANMRKFVSAIESIYSGIECGHFSLSPAMHEYIALIYLLCERIGGSATSMANHAVDHLLAAIDSGCVDRSLVKALVLSMDREISANPDSEVLDWERLLKYL